MRQEKLSDLLDISIGRTPSRNEPSYWGKGYHWASIRDLSSKIVTETKEQITDRAVTDARCKIVKKGTLLFSFKLTIGKMAFAGCDLFTNEAIAAFAIKDEAVLNPEFLYYALQSATYGGSNQAVMGKTLNSKSLADIEIPLPPLDDQIRIAYLLGKVERLITQRKQHLQQLDGLLKSIFLEMFGDPVRNEKGWTISSLSKYGLFKNGLNFTKGENGVKVRYLGVGDFKSKAELQDFDSLAFIELNEQPTDDYFLHDGDLLFVRSNGNKELVGRCMAVYPGTTKVTYSGFCIRFRITSSSLQATYIAHLFRSTAFRSVLLQGGQGANIQNINQKILSCLSIPIPDERLQNQFATIVEKVERLKYRYQQSLTDLECLYSALSQQIFNGELNLSKVPMPILPTQNVTTVSQEEQATMPAPVIKAVSAVRLPNTDNLQVALENVEARKTLIAEWLEAYRTQLADTSFSLQQFMEIAQSRLSEIHPDNDFVLDASDFEYIKTWVFEALAIGKLTQEFDDSANCIELKAAIEQSST
ncbi:restriction endonuclease subunit S [Providencia sp. 2024EL-00732]|uniref:restriction endonuclease subunit S n=1 Tax=Providencia sp. 2024EL-00732 TaxID=3374242 RepID=UPI0037565A92